MDADAGHVLWEHLLTRHPPRGASPVYLELGKEKLVASLVLRAKQGGIVVRKIVMDACRARRDISRAVKAVKVANVVRRASTKKKRLPPNARSARSL
jgi:hypothetical protein